ncbi:MAG TPA: TetR/AcrR family transcriptional regulator [Acidobacteriaceae bacterium]
MPHVKKDSVAAGDGSGAGRAAQRNRTRRAIIEAAMRLLEAGGTPSMAEIAQEAEVSRRTVYMYFPTLEQLLIDATLGVLSARKIDVAVAESATKDPVERVEELCRAMNQDSGETMHLGRALIRLTVEGEDPAAGGPRRGYRRVRWVEEALGGIRGQLRDEDYERLVSALCVLLGWEPMIALKDVRGLDPEAAGEVLAFAVRAVVEKALREAEERGRQEAGG